MDVRPQVGTPLFGGPPWPSRPAPPTRADPSTASPRGSILKGARVEIRGTPEVKVDQLDLEGLRPTARLWVREVLDHPLRADQQPRDATVLRRNLERVFRTPQETELGRDFRPRRRPSTRARFT